jgi:hypothetical protein
MAGSVIIDNRTAVAFSSRGFDIVTELTREVLKITDPDLIANIFESLDVECMPFISLDALSGRDVERFYVATKKAFVDWQQHNPEPFSDWQELINRLETDQRIN